jgi:uncharacterized protein
MSTSRCAPKFIGRQRELERLKALYRKKIPSLIVMKGRRRIGKSRLIAEFASRNTDKAFWDFSGLAPQRGFTAQKQRDHFARRLATLSKLPPLTFGDWDDAFEHLSLQLKEGDIVLFDEISWMGSKDPTFISKLKAWWDNQKHHIFFVICGSVSPWIEDNILNSTAFFGRINLTLTLNPLSIPESANFLRKMGFKSSDYDHYKLLSILGGIPWYLEQIDPSISVDENIKQLAFDQNGLLVLEFDRIFHDLFNTRGSRYKKILEILKDGAKTLSDLRTLLNFSHSGTLGQMMEHLVVAGFVHKQALWSFKTEKPLKQSLYRLADPYTRFYLKVIKPNLPKISVGGFKDIDHQPIREVDDHLGVQLEYLLLQNRPLLLKSMGISGAQIVADGPYRQSTTTAHKGCQIDYLVQTVTKNIFICEFKFRKRELGSEVIQEVHDKISALKVPKGFATLSVLFHLGGVSSSTLTSPSLYRVIDIADFLEEEAS